jgi:carbonic anhydrase/acetyltransferase-like protein (isoleucine patch superfamily)
MPVYALDADVPTLPAPGRYWIAPDADVIGKVVLGEDVAIWFGSVLRGDIEWIRVGPRTNVQDLSVLHTDSANALHIGRDVTVGHRAILHGCTIGDNTLIGMGAVVLTGARIGRDCLIAAHALVAEGKEIPDGSLVMGVPGRVVRQLTPAEIEANAASATRYVKRWRQFASTGFRRVD